MPLGDGTGPRGMGSMTGRGLGYCTGSGQPGYATRVSGRGGAGFNRGSGRGMGRGRGRSTVGRGFNRLASYFRW
jgi:hypothetical protein